MIYASVILKFFISGISLSFQSSTENILEHHSLIFKKRTWRRFEFCLTEDNLLPTQSPPRSWKSEATARNLYQSWIVKREGTTEWLPPESLSKLRNGMEPQAHLWSPVEWEDALWVPPCWQETTVQVSTILLNFRNCFQAVITQRIIAIIQLSPLQRDYINKAINNVKQCNNLLYHCRTTNITRRWRSRWCFSELCTAVAWPLGKFCTRFPWKHLEAAENTI